MLQQDRVLRERHAVIRMACERQQKVTLDYEDESGSRSLRVVWPLGIVGLMGKWLLLAWCEVRSDYRTFRFDRLQSLALCKDHFETLPTLNMDHYFAQQMKAD